MEIYYYERRDGTVSATNGIDPFLSNSDDTARVFRLDGDRLKCVHDNDTQPWGYHLNKEDSMLIMLKAGTPAESLSISDFDDY